MTAAEETDGPDAQRAPKRKQAQNVGAMEQTDCLSLSQPALLLSLARVIPDWLLALLYIVVDASQLPCVPQLEIRVIFTASSSSSSL